MNKNNLPRKWNYSGYSSGNYGAHTIAVDIPPTRKGKHGIILYFSYDTIVAFRGFIDNDNYGLFVAKNIWGATTGKHLNMIYSNKSKRLDYNVFEKLYNKALKNA